MDLEIVEGTGSPSKNIFEVLSKFQRSPTASDLRSKLEQYLATPTEGAKDAVKWWYDNAESTRALMCLGAWSKVGMVRNSDLKEAAELPDVLKDEELEVDDAWDTLRIK
ncbi:hypothetical protein H0H92_015106 [Tricholoma furcatifolium]|nr:hypothetical protein H0H92_015106 [Tricholoma furcatifolium]